MFIEDRSILDNVLVAIEIIHQLRCKARGRLRKVAFKIDITKAFNIVDSNFLEDMMRNLGFADQ